MVIGYFLYLDLRGLLIVFIFVVVWYFQVDLFDYIFLIFDFLTANWLEKGTFYQFGVRCVFWFSTHWSSICILSPVSLGKEPLHVPNRFLSRVNAWWLNWLWHLPFYIWYLYLYNRSRCLLKVCSKTPISDKNIFKAFKCSYLNEFQSIKSTQTSGWFFLA